MRQVRWASWLGAVAVTMGFISAGPAAADVTSDRPAAVLNYPLVVVSEETDPRVDTVIQLSNTSEEPVTVQCFYENANAHCSNTGEVCFFASDCCEGGFCGVCLPGWNETDFFIRLTPLQPIGWTASAGLTQFPIDGFLRTGIGGSSNAGSRIPPVPEDPFLGLLKCVVVDDTGIPVDRNVIKGEATLTIFGGENIDVSKYNAVGIQAIEGAVNDDKILVLGGPEAEFNGCPNILILNHFFDGVSAPVTDEEVNTLISLVPCTQDLLRQVPGAAVIQFLVFNEFEQRFSTSRSIQCQGVFALSTIDTTQPNRSIFSAGVAGTVTGQTRMNPIGSGLVGVAVEVHDSSLPITPVSISSDSSTAAFNIHFQGNREDADLITLP